MRIIISPAKKMNVDTDTLPALGMPVFLKDTECIMDWMKALSYREAKALWGCNDKLTEQNYRRFQEMDLHKNGTPAILSYEGIQYQYMAPAVFEEGMLAYVQEHLRILSGFYGVLKPMDGVTPYRLEMQAKAGIDGKKDLYDYWGKKLYDEVTDGDHVIINLASKEYAQCVEPYLTAEDTYITCIFGEAAGEKDSFPGRNLPEKPLRKECGRAPVKIVQKGTYAKMARGEMVRFLAERGAECPEIMKDFDRLGYVFLEELSSPTKYVFCRNLSKEGIFK